MNKKYLDDLGLAEVASIVNQKLKQVSEMPLASEELSGKIYQYVGNTTSLYTNCYFYGCEEVGGSYQWVRKNVQDDTPHVTGTGNEIDSLISTNGIPDGAYVGIVDDYDNAYGSPYKKAYINTGAPAYGDEVLESTNVYDAIEELLRSWKTKSDTERNAFACTGLITLTNSDGDTRVPGLCGSYLLTTQRGIDTGTNYFVRLEIWNNPNTFTAGGQTILTANLTQLGIFYCDYSIINQPYSTSEVQTGTRWIDGKPIYRKCIVFTTAFPSVSIPNIKDLITTSGFISTVGGSPYNELPFPWFRLNGATTEEAKCYLQSGTNISWVVQNLGLSSTKESVVILEYTKTTDA